MIIATTGVFASIHARVEKVMAIPVRMVMMPVRKMAVVPMWWYRRRCPVVDDAVVTDDRDNDNFG